MAALHNLVVCAAMMVFAGFADRSWNEITARNSHVVPGTSHENFTFETILSPLPQETLAPLSRLHVNNFTMTTENESSGTAGWAWSPWIWAGILAVFLLLTTLTCFLSQFHRRAKDLEFELSSLYEVASKKLAHDRQWIVSFEAHNTTASEQLPGLEDEIAELKKEMAELSAAVVSSNKTNAELEKGKADAERRAMEAENSVGDLTAQLSEARGSYDSVKRDLATALTSNSEKQRTIDSMEKKQVDLEADLDTARALETYSDECLEEEKVKVTNLKREVDVRGQFIGNLQCKLFKVRIHDEMKSKQIVWLENEIQGLLNDKAVEATSSGTSSVAADNVATEQKTPPSDVQLKKSTESDAVIEESAEKDTKDPQYTDASIMEEVPEISTEDTSATDMPEVPETLKEDTPATDMPNTQLEETQITETGDTEGGETASDLDEEQMPDKPKRRRQRGKHLSGAEKARRKKAREAEQAELAAQQEKSNDD